VGLKYQNIKFSTHHLIRSQTATFTAKLFWRIRLSGAPLGALPADVFNDIAFEEVYLTTCNISSVDPMAFRASQPYMDTMYLYSNQLTVRDVGKTSF